MIQRKTYIGFILLLALLDVAASELSIPNSFIAGTPALASEVNNNFIAVKNSVDDNDQRIRDLNNFVTQLAFEFDNLSDDLEQANDTINDQQLIISNLQSVIANQNIDIQQLQQDLNQLDNQVETIASNSVLELDGLLKYSEVNNYPTAEFSAVNVQINSGAGSTYAEENGLGNVIIGYNEVAFNFELYFCLDGTQQNQIDCINAGSSWVNAVRTGSHNLIIGDSNAYSKSASLIAGSNNISNANNTVVLGNSNIAQGNFSTILGGQVNKANSDYSTITAGLSNAISTNASNSSIYGGRANTINGGFSSILGGYLNTIESQNAVIVSGYNNLVDANFGTVTGGKNNSASGLYSVVSGGASNSSLGDESVVSGGFGRVANAKYDWRAGSLFEEQ